MSGRAWSAEDVDYIESKWGEISIPSICKNLGRTENAINVKVQRL